MKSILVVADDLLIGIYIKQVLMESGYEIEVARDVIEGLENLKQKTYDMIIIDDDMPQMKGKELYEVLSQSHSLVKILTLSSTVDGFIESNGFFLGKPFSAKQLTEAVKKLIT